jgi:putative ABC transport system permease protein
MISLVYTTLELALIGSLTVLGLYLSYLTLDVCDLSTDGCFTLGACAAAVIALSGHPYLAIAGAMISGLLSGLTVSFLQTFCGINSLLSGIIVNTALYSVNIAIMGNSSLLNLNKAKTIYTIIKEIFQDTFLKGYSFLLIDFTFVLAVTCFLNWFLKTRIGLAVKATGDNPFMVEASSIDARITTIIALSISNSFTALSGALLAMSQKSVNIDIGNGMVTIALASLLIGKILSRSRKTSVRLLCSVLGSLIFRSVYALALRFNMPAYMLKFVSAVIVAVTISLPYLKRQIPMLQRKAMIRRGASR